MRAWKSILLFCVMLLLSGCFGIAGHWMCCPPVGKDYPFGARWVKEGMTRESRKADWVACGGGADLRLEFRDWVSPESWESFWSSKQLHIKQLSSCMQSKGYDYRNPQKPGKPDECDVGGCLYP
jgi:hypothetical protein